MWPCTESSLVTVMLSMDGQLQSVKPYANHKDVLSIESRCLLSGRRVVVPPKLRVPLLQELHRSHPGVTRMKAIARSYMCWPGLDKAVEELVRNSIPCQSNRHNLLQLPFIPGPGQVNDGREFTLLSHFSEGCFWLQWICILNGWGSWRCPQQRQLNYQCLASHVCYL